MQETPPLSDGRSFSDSRSFQVHSQVHTAEPEYGWEAAHGSLPQSALEAASTFYFANERWRHGALWVVQGIVSILIAAYLLSQIPIAPKVVNQLLLCSGFMSGLGLFGLWRASKDLMSRVRVTNGGIVLHEFVNQRFVPWSELEGWIVRTAPDSDDSLPSVEIAVRGNKPRIEISSGSLTFGDLVALKAIMTSKAAELCFG